MRNVTRWLLIWILAVLALAGCDLIPRVTPVADTEPTRASATIVATEPGATTLPPITSAPGATDAPGKPTPVPQPTALSEPAIVDRWQLSQIPAQGRDPAYIASVDDMVLVVNAETDNVTLIRKNRIANVVALEAPGLDKSDLYITSLVPDQANQCAYIATYSASSETRLGAILRIGLDGVLTHWPTLNHIQHMTLVDGKLAYRFYDGSTVFLLDPANGDIVAEIEIANDKAIRGMVGDPGRPRLYVTVDDSHLLGIDTVTGAHIASASLTDPITDLVLSPDGSRLLAATLGTPNLLALDAATLDTIASVSLRKSPTDLVVSPATGHVAAALAHGDSVLVVDQDLEIVWDLPFASVRCMAYGKRDVLYLADADLDNVTVFNPVLSSMPPIIPLSEQYGDMEVDPVNGRVLVSLTNQNQLLVLDKNGAEQARFATGSEPRAIAVWPGQAQIAVVEKGDQQVALYSLKGQLVKRYPVGRYAGGVMVDPISQDLIAGDQRVDTRSATTRSLAATVHLDQSATPIKTVMDTRRRRLYGIVDNGVPGSNGGWIVRLLEAPEGSTGPDQVGWRSVQDVIYDEEHDRFLVGWAHMGINGLAIVDAETGRVVHDLDLDMHTPTAMALNPASRHLWVATVESVASLDNEAIHRLIAWDTRTMARIFDAEIDTLIDHMAVDVGAMRIYMASEEAGAVFVLQDIVDRSAVAPPGPPTATPLPSRAVIPTLPPPPTSTPAVAPCALPAHPVIALVAPVQDAGCPLNEGAATNVAVQPFERGRMIWRQDTGEVMVLLDSGILIRVEDAWREGMPNHACDAGAAPEGLWQPIRGFGLAWCEIPGLRQDLGWATEPEAGATGIAQRFKVGEFLHIDGGKTLFLGNQGAWKGVSGE